MCERERERVRVREREGEEEREREREREGEIGRGKEGERERDIDRGSLGERESARLRVGERECAPATSAATALPSPRTARAPAAAPSFPKRKRIRLGEARCWSLPRAAHGVSLLRPARP